MDPIKDGGNWYQYVYSNPIIYFDPDGQLVVTLNKGISAIGLIGASTGVSYAADLHLNYGIYGTSSVLAGTSSLSRTNSIGVYLVDSIDDLTGVSYTYGFGLNGTAFGWPFSVTVEVSHARLKDGSLGWGFTISAGPGISIPVEFHAGVGNTEEIVSGNVIDNLHSMLSFAIKFYDKIQTILNSAKIYFENYSGFR